MNGNKFSVLVFVDPLMWMRLSYLKNFTGYYFAYEFSDSDNNASTGKPIAEKLEYVIK